MTNNIYKIALIVVSIIAILLFVKSCQDKETVTMDIPIEIDVPVPVVERVIDTVYKDSIVVRWLKPDKEVVIEYRNSNYETQDSLYVDATTIRNYLEVVEDDILIGEIFMQTQGKLNKYNFEYKTKPRIIRVDTVIRKTLEIPYNNRFAIGAQVGNPIGKTFQGTLEQPKLRFDTYLDTKNILLNVSTDTDGYLWVGAAYKF